MASFFAYPSRPVELVTPIRRATELVNAASPGKIHSWEQGDIAGQFITQPITDAIMQSPFVCADVTFHNFNVFYEIGYAIARKKRPVLLLNKSLAGDYKQNERVRLLDSIGYTSYVSTAELTTILSDLSPPPGSLISSSIKDRSLPVYYLRTPLPVDFDVQTKSRLKKARLQFRHHDAEETGPLTAAEAIDEVSKSFGVVGHFLPPMYERSREHNLEMAFVLGLAHGFEIEVLFMQSGLDPIPLDYRELVNTWKDVDQIAGLVGDFAPLIYERTSQSKPEPRRSSLSGLRRLHLGSPAAENEFTDLQHYFIETEEYNRVMRGEVQVASGRKGSGKTAIFARARSQLRENKQNLVLDLQPEGRQLLKIKDVFMSMLGEGTKEHTIVAFWEYLILIEICHKLLRDDIRKHLVNHQLYEPYRKLEETFGLHKIAREGDFAERLLSLVESLEGSFESMRSKSSGEQLTLSQAQITSLLHKSDIRPLRQSIAAYLARRPNIWVLFDNLDKGWSAFGVSNDDILLIRCLQAALAKVRNDFERMGIAFRGTLFLRDDVWELVVDQTPDRGKVSVVKLDWDDPELLRELIRRRVVHALGMDKNASFEDAWSQVCVSHYESEESSQYLIDRSLMRPRALIDLVQKCVSHAVNIGHERVEAQDVRIGEKGYSEQLLQQVGYELRDVRPDTEDVMYAFIGSPAMVTANDIERCVAQSAMKLSIEDVIKYLLWYGVLGIVDPKTTEPVYIYNVGYDFKRIAAMMRFGKNNESDMYYFNPALHASLGITT